MVMMMGRRYQSETKHEHISKHSLSRFADLASFKNCGSIKDPQTAPMERRAAGCILENVIALELRRFTFAEFRIVY